MRSDRQSRALARGKTPGESPPNCPIEISLKNMIYSPQISATLRRADPIIVAVAWRPIVLRTTLVALTLTSSLLSAPALQAGTIENACRSSSRGAAQPTLCHCIQQVAETSLTRSEQRAVSKFFAEPHRAQEVRQSDKRSDTQLWQRYIQFGSEAERVCG